MLISNKIFPITLLIFISSLAYGQTTTKNFSLKHKRIGIYLSNKNFSFTPFYYKSFSHFIQNDDSTNLAEESIKRGAAVQLGIYAAQIFNQELETDSSYYINGYPHIAKAFIDASHHGKINIDQLKSKLLTRTDFIINIKKLTFKHVERQSLVGFSKSLYMEKRYVRIVDMEWDVYDINLGSKIASIDVAFDEDQAPKTYQFIPWTRTVAAGEQMLSRLLDLGLVEWQQSNLNRP
jgi:hypothetical protein